MISPPDNGKTKTVKGWDVGVLRIEGVDVEPFVRVVDVIRIGYKTDKGYALTSEEYRLAQVRLLPSAQWNVLQAARHGDRYVGTISRFQPAVAFLALGGSYQALYRFTQKDLAS